MTTLKNNLQNQVDLPVWEWMRLYPVAAPTFTAMVGDWDCSYTGGTPRYGYHINGATFYRYDTVTDSWNQLATCPTPPTPANPPTYAAALVYNPAQGHYGRAIGPGPGTNTIQMAGLTGTTLVGYKIMIIAGTGAGQERTIQAVAEPVISDSGFVTTYTPGPPTLLTDATTGVTVKNWKYNQWRDYQVRLTVGTGQNQVRKILYNSANTVYIQDYTYANLNMPWYGGQFVTAPASAATYYQIESSIVTVSSAWTTLPDNTSKFVVKGGGIWYASGVNYATARYLLSYYDILADVWYVKGTQTGFLAASLSTYDVSLESCNEVEGGVTTNSAWNSPLIANTGTVSVASAPYNKRTLIDSGQNMPVNKYANMMIRLTGGTGVGQNRAIIANNTTTFIIGRDWDVIPDSTTTYQVLGDSDKLYLMPEQAQSVMGQYSFENDMITTGRQFDYGVARTFWAQIAPYGIATVSVTNGGTGGSYAVGDILTLTTNGLYTGINGTVTVATLTGSQVATVTLNTAGAGYIVSATAYATTSGNQGGGTGTGCTITVATNAIPSQPAIGVTAMARTATGIATVAVGNNAGVGYNVNDLVNVTGGSAILRVIAVTAVGGVSSLSVEVPNTGYSVANNVATTINSTKSASATGLTVNVTAIADTNTVTSTVNHNFTIGDVVLIGGADTLASNTSSTYFGGYRIVTGVPSVTTFTCSIPTGCTVSVTVSGGTVNSINSISAAGAKYGSQGSAGLFYAGTGVCAIPTITSGGTGYAVGDLLLITPTAGAGSYVMGGIGVTGSAIVKVATVTTGGVVATITLMASGNGYAASTLYQTTNLGNSPIGTTGGSSINGSGCTLTTLAVASGGIGTLYSVTGGGGTTALLAVTAVTTAGGVSTAYIAAAGSGYTTGTQTLTLVPSGAAAIFNAEALSTTLLVDTTKNWQANELVGNTLAIGLPGTCSTFQYRRIIANTSHTITFALAVTLPVCGTYRYVIHDPKPLGTESTNKSTPAQYAWGTASGGGSSTTLIDAPSSPGLGTVAVVAGGTGYAVGDTITLAMGTNGTVKVTSINSGAVATVSVLTPGSGYTAGTVYTTTDSGSGTSCTINVITTNAKNWIVNQWAGKKVKIVAGTGVNAFPNEIYISSNTANTLTTSGITSASVSNGGTTTTYVVGDILTLVTAAPNTVSGGTVRVATVSSGSVLTVTVETQGAGYAASTTYNTTGGTGAGATITVNSITSFGFTPDATTVYAIMDNWGTASAAGLAVYSITGSATTSYNVGDILVFAQGSGGANTVVKVTAVTTGTPTHFQILNPGSGLVVTTAYTTTCLTSNGAGITITTGTPASSLTTAGAATVLNDPYQNWGAGGASGALVTKELRITSGSVVGQETPITQTAATALTFASATAPDGNSQYGVYGILTRGAAASVGVSSLMRLFGTSVLNKAQYMISWRGNTTATIDRYDITQDMWEFLTQSPLTETYTLGAMFEYNCKDRIYISSTLTTAGRIMYYDLAKNIIVPCGTVPYGMGAGAQGNKMFTMSTSSFSPLGLEYLYVMRNSGQEFWRVLIYW